jgi:hypothetical protein
MGLVQKVPAAVAGVDRIVRIAESTVRAGLQLAD